MPEHLHIKFIFKKRKQPSTTPSSDLKLMWINKPEYIETTGSSEASTSREWSTPNASREKCLKGINKYLILKKVKNETLNYNCTMQKCGKNST